MEWKNIFAELVRTAIEKDYTPDEVRDDFESFESAFKDFFGETFHILRPRNCVRFENLVIHGCEIKKAEEVLIKNGILDADAPALLQKIADVLLGNSLYI